MIKENKKISDKDLKIIKVINSVYKKNGEIESDKSVEEIETGLVDAGLRVTGKYLQTMLDKSQEMLDAGIGDIEKEALSHRIMNEDISVSDFVMDPNGIVYSTKTLLKDYKPVKATDFICDEDEHFLAEISNEDGEHVLQCPYCQKKTIYINDDPETMEDLKESKKIVKEDTSDFDETKDQGIWDGVTTRMADCCPDIFGFKSEEISEKDWNDLGDILVRIYKKNKSNISEDVEKTFKGPATDKELELSRLIADGIKDEYETIKLYNDIAFIARKHGRDDIAKLIDNINTEENNHVGMLQQALRTISANADAVEDGDKEAFDYLNDDDFKVAANESFEDFLIDDEDEDFIDRTYHDASEDELIKMSAFDNLNDDDDKIDESVEEIDDDVSIDINDSKLKEIYDNLNAGKVYGEILNRGKSSRELPWEVLSVSPDKKFIRYRHYGSSAVENDIEELAWVLQVIFGMKPEEFLSKYELLGSNIDSVDITEDREISTEIDEYQKWVDYDMKKYGKISDTTKSMINRAGFEIIKDKYDDYEVIAKSDKSGLADTMKEYQTWVDYDMKHYGHISDKTQSEIEKAGFKIVKDDHGDYEVID